MSYSLFSENGYIDDVATVGGWWVLIQEVAKVRSSGALRKFLDDGKTTKIKEVINEIDNILPEIKDDNSRRVLEGLKTGLQKVKEVAIVSG